VHCWCLMSALGQKLKCGVAPARSASCQERTFSDHPVPCFPTILRRAFTWAASRAIVSCCYCVEPFKLCGVQTAIVRIRTPPSSAMRAEHLCRWDALHAAHPIGRTQNSASTCGAPLDQQTQPTFAAGMPCMRRTQSHERKILQRVWRGP